MGVLRDKNSLRTRWLLWSIPKLFFACSQLLFRSCRINYLDKQHEDQFLRNRLANPVSPPG
jgi:hypothetical protein